MIRRRRKSRPRTLTWLDGVASSPIQVAAGGLVVIAAMLVALVWGAAVGSSWLVNGQAADVSLNDAVLAMIRLGSNELAWDGAWPDDIEAELAGAGWFWIIFGVEVLTLVLAFWPAWRIFGPNPGDPAGVFITPTPVNHPRAARRQAEEEARQSTPPQPVEIVTGPPTALTPTATPVPVPPASLDKILIDGPASHRLVLGQLGPKLVGTESQNSAIVFGSIQAGRTNSITAPAILDWDGPVLVATSKPELVTGTWRGRGSAGRAWLFDPAGAMSTAEGVVVQGPKLGHGWSPLHAIEAAASHRGQPSREVLTQQWSLARRASQWMVGGSRALDQGDFASTSYVAAEQLLGPLLLAAAIDDASMDQVKMWADRRSVDEVTSILEEAGAAEAATAWWSTNNNDPAAASGAYQVLSMILYSYGDPAVLAQAREPEISIDGLLDGRRNSLFIVAPTNQDRLQPLFTALLSELADGAMSTAMASPSGHLSTPLLIVLDDVVGCTSPTVLDELAGGGASMGIQVLTALTDLAGLTRKIGADRAVQLAGNHLARVALPGITDPTTLNYMSSLSSGADLIDSSHFGYGTSGPPSAGSWATGSTSWLRTLDDGEAVCIYGNLPPIQMHLRGQSIDDTRPVQRVESTVESPPQRAKRSRRSSDDDLLVPGMPDPLDSDANDRESARYWESLTKGGSGGINPFGGDGR